MITSKLTTNGRTNIPKHVRAALHLEPGDELAYEINGRRVILTKADHGSKTSDPFRRFHEWNSKADTRSYRKL